MSTTQSLQPLLVSVILVVSAVCSDPLLCSQILPPPEQPFRVVWNHPDPCEKQGVHMNFSDYGIVFNKGRKFIGDEVQTLYRTGKWPSYSGNHPVSGGLPQLWSDTTFSQTRADLSQYRIANFTGLAILDYEGWRPSFVTNFGALAVYQRESRNLVRQRHPELTSASAIEAEATREWEEAARSILQSKLAVGQELMPRGHWGYYMYPRSWAGNSSPLQNNKVASLWRQATGLYPSIYLTNPNDSPQHKYSRVYKEVKEAVRIQNAFSPPNTPIYPFSNIEQGAYQFFNQDHLKFTLGLPADMGASGIVLWGSSGYYRASGQCSRLQQHVRHVLGPYVLKLTQFTSNCSAAVCNGNGRCVNNTQDTLIDENEAVRLSAQCTSRDSNFYGYHCRCYSGWSGPCCENYTPLPCQQSQMSGSENQQSQNTTETHNSENGHLIG